MYILTTFGYCKQQIVFYAVLWRSDSVDNNVEKYEIAKSNDEMVRMPQRAKLDRSEVVLLLNSPRNHVACEYGGISNDEVFQEGEWLENVSIVC